MRDPRIFNQIMGKIRDIIMNELMIPATLHGRECEKGADAGAGNRSIMMTDRDRTGQVECISEMEDRLNRAAAAAEALSEALDRFGEVQEDIRILEDYYQSPAWRRDFEDDEAGLIPKDLPRGVLSEDAIYDLLTDEQELRARMRELAEASGDGCGE